LDQLNLTCNPALAIIETLQIEGHADNEGGFAQNLALSAARASSAFTEMAPSIAGREPEMLGFQNLLEQPVLAVSAYSFSRPLATNDTTEGRAANRRIDLRFIMYVPPGVEFIPISVEDIHAISAKLLAARRVGGND